MITHHVSTLPGAVLVCAKQQQPALPGYGSEQSTCQGPCPGGELDIANPSFKGDKSLGMWKWMYRVAWPHCQKPVLDYFSVVVKARLRQAIAKRCGVFSTSFCLPLHVKLAWTPMLCSSCMCNDKSAVPLRDLSVPNRATAESLSSGCNRMF